MGKLRQWVAYRDVAATLLALTQIPTLGCGGAALSQRRHSVGGVFAAGQATYPPGPEVCEEDGSEDLCGNAVGFRWGYDVAYELVVWESRGKSIALAAEVPLTALHAARRFESAPDVPTYSGVWITPGPKLVLGRDKRGQWGVSAGPGWVRFVDDTAKDGFRRSVAGTAWQFGTTVDWQLRRALSARGLLRVFGGRTPPAWANTAQTSDHSLLGAGLVLSF